MAKSAIEPTQAQRPSHTARRSPANPSPRGHRCRRYRPSGRTSSPPGCFRRPPVRRQTRRQSRPGPSGAATARRSTANWRGCGRRLVARSPRSTVSSMHALANALSDVEPRFEESDYARVVGYVRSHLHRRSLVILFTDVIDPVAQGTVLAELSTLAKRHVVLCAFMNDAAVAQTLATVPRMVDDAYRLDVALGLEHERTVAAKTLERSGIIVLDARGYRCRDERAPGGRFPRHALRSVHPWSGRCSPRRPRFANQSGGRYWISSSNRLGLTTFGRVVVLRRRSHGREPGLNVLRCERAACGG